MRIKSAFDIETVKVKRGFKAGQEDTLRYDENENLLLTPVTNPAQLRGTESLRMVGKYCIKMRKK